MTFLSCLATFQVLMSHMWLVVTVLDSMDIEHVHQCRKFYCIALVFSILKQNMPVEYVILNCAVL